MVSNEKGTHNLFLNRAFSFELRFQGNWGVQALMIASKVVRNFHSLWNPGSHVCFFLVVT